MVYVAFCAAGVLAFLGAGLLAWACRDYARSAERSAERAWQAELRGEERERAAWRRRKAEGPGEPEEVLDAGRVEFPAEYQEYGGEG